MRAIEFFRLLSLWAAVAGVLLVLIVVTLIGFWGWFGLYLFINFCFAFAAWRDDRADSGQECTGSVPPAAEGNHVR